MTKENNEDFETKCWICNNDYVDTDVKVRYHCHENPENLENPEVLRIETVISMLN